MNRGIELLLARMKSNPDEFEPSAYNVSAGSMWDNLVHDWRHCLTEEELATYKTALNEVHRELFAQKVMKHILTAGETYGVVETPMRQPYQHPYNNSNITLASPHTTTGVISVGKETIDEQMLAQMKEIIKAEKERRAK
jgi:hypothetical protein